MKKICTFAAIIAASLTLASCGLGTTGTTTNDSNATLQQAGTDLLGTVLSSILGNTTSQQSLVGSWTYYGPKVVFESENILSQLGGQVISSNLEQKLGTQLSKMGFSAGKSKLTLNNDGTCTLTLGSKTLNGTYTYDVNSHKLMLTDVLGLGQMACTASVQSGQLMMLFEADKLLSVATSISSKSTSTLASLLQSYTGLKLGWAMTK
jgi:hypothetical protein